MATKGEKIVTILCGAAVNPVEPEKTWPKDWKHAPESGGKPIRSDMATVQAVFLRDGAVWLLVQSLFEGKLAESPAIEWKVERNP